MNGGGTMSVHIQSDGIHHFPETILLPGDPLRAKYIAETFLEDAKLFNEVRGMLGYCGRYEGVEVAVMGTGMGMPSHSIYVHELIHDFGAKRLIRIGSCGALQEDIQLRDIVLSMSACFDSSLNDRLFNGMGYAPTADFALLQQAHEHARAQKLSVRVGSVLSSDFFYNDDDPDGWKLWQRYGVLAVEMETAALYALAARAGVSALSILTVSDSLPSGERLSSEERETGFAAMARLALGLAGA